jgi:hypothetical protein
MLSQSDVKIDNVGGMSVGRLSRTRPSQRREREEPVIRLAARVALSYSHSTHIYTFSYEDLISMFDLRGPIRQLGPSKVEISS